MALKVLVVDDSAFFCRTVGGIINRQPEFDVVGVANNGEEAIRKVIDLKPDLVTMDVEMPIMDGITALREIMKVQPTLVIMFSSLTYEGAKMTMDALNAGAADFVLKTYTDVAANHPDAGKELIDKLKEVSSAKLQGIKQSILKQDSHVVTSGSIKKNLNHPVNVIVIGASTGGPIAIQNIVMALPDSFPVPILVTQHMPENFTSAYASRLDGMSKVHIMEAKNGDVLKPGVVYVAPGGKQMIVSGTIPNVSIKILSADTRLNYHPSVDVTFAAVSKVYQNRALAIVLTGMGADGRDGARLLKSAGSSVWVQDESSCVVYGMPASVANAGLADEEVPVNLIAHRLISEVM